MVGVDSAQDFEKKLVQLLRVMNHGISPLGFEPYWIAVVEMRKALYTITAKNNRKNTLTVVNASEIQKSELCKYVMKSVTISILIDMIAEPSLQIVTFSSSFMIDVFDALQIWCHPIIGIVPQQNFGTAKDDSVNMFYSSIAMSTIFWQQA